MTPTTKAGAALAEWLVGDFAGAILDIEAEARTRALDEALAAVRRLNGDGFHEPSEPALEAADAAIRALRDGDGS